MQKLSTFVVYFCRCKRDVQISTVMNWAKYANALSSALQGGTKLLYLLPQLSITPVDDVLVAPEDEAGIGDPR